MGRIMNRIIRIIRIGRIIRPISQKCNTNVEVNSNLDFLYYMCSTNRNLSSPIRNCTVPDGSHRIIRAFVKGLHVKHEKLRSPRPPATGATGRLALAPLLSNDI